MIAGWIVPSTVPRPVPVQSTTPGQSNNASDYYNLACNYEQNLKNDKEALEAYLKAAKISGEEKEPGRYENPVKD